MVQRYLGLTMLLAAAQIPLAASAIYAISSFGEGWTGRQELYGIDPITGVLTRVGPVMDGSHPAGLDSLAFSPSLGLYGVGHGDLYDINTSNGHVTEIGALGANLSALVYGPNGALYGTAGNRLYSVDPATGKASLIGMGNYGPPESLEFDATGVLYATVGGSGVNSLYRIDPATGAGTLVGRIGFRDVQGLAFVNGTMFGFTGSGLEIAINLTNGSGTFVREVGIGFTATAADPPEAPEPASLWLAGAGLAGLWRWRTLQRCLRHSPSAPFNSAPP